MNKLLMLAVIVLSACARADKREAAGNTRLPAKYHIEMTHQYGLYKDINSFSQDSMGVFTIVDTHGRTYHLYQGGASILINDIK